MDTQENDAKNGLFKTSTRWEMSVCIDSSASKVMPVKERVLFSNDAIA